MTRADASDDVIGALAPYFSAPIARALLISTLRRARLGEGPVLRGALPRLVAALEEILPMYISTEARRTGCVGQLRRLAARARSSSSAPRNTGLGRADGGSIIRVTSGEDVIKACDAGREIARSVGFVPLERTKIATAISELARNIALYAGSGELRMIAIDVPRRGIEIVARDDGPGIVDLDLVMSSAYRSRTGMGMGLKGAKRLMDTFEIESAPGIGTNVVARRYINE